MYSCVHYRLGQYISVVISLLTLSCVRYRLGINRLWAFSSRRYPDNSTYLWIRITTFLRSVLSHLLQVAVHYLQPMSLVPMKFCPLILRLLYGIIILPFIMRHILGIYLLFLLSFL